MKKFFIMLASLILLNACSTAEDEHSENQIIVDNIFIDPVPPINPALIDIAPDASCIECKMYFCPPLDSVWQKEICMNICEDPPTLYSETECTEYMECDPTQYLMASLECTTDDGYPGMQDKVCNKGKIQYTDCVSDCFEESWS